MATYSFTAYRAADLFTGPAEFGTEFSVVVSAGLTFSVTDDDAFLSGDQSVSGIAEDDTEQTSIVSEGGTQLSGDAVVYGDRAIFALGSNGMGYLLAEVRQIGNDEIFYTFVRGAPPSDITLTLSSSYESRTEGFDYTDLGGEQRVDPVPDDMTSGTDEGEVIKTGLGDDMVVGLGGSDVLRLGGGNDTGMGGTGSEVILGAKGADNLMGQAGRDTVSGGAGDDMLAGGRGADHFVFHADGAENVVVDFGKGADVVDLTAMGMTSWGEVMDSAAQVGSDVVITVEDTVIVLEKVLLSDLTDSNLLY